jgi:hypothetical protein
MLIESIPVNKEVIPLFILNRNKRSSLGSTVYCTECQKTFFIPEVLVPNSKLYSCSNCNTTSYISASDQIERVILELHEENNKRSASIIHKNSSFKFKGDELEKKEKNSVLSFDPESFISSDSETFKFWDYLDVDNPISFIYKATKYKLGANAKLFEQQYYRIYKTISEYLFGEELPVNLFFAYMVYDHFPILKLSSDFLYSLKYDKHREIFKDMEISTVKDLINFMELPYKKSIVRNLLDTPIKKIDFYRLPIICKQFDNLDIKTSVLKHILNYYNARNEYNEHVNNLFLLPEHFEVFAKDVKKELSENKLADFIMRDDDKRESLSPDISYGYTQKSNSFLNYPHNYDTLRMYHTIKKDNEFKNMEILKQEKKCFTPQHLHDTFSKIQNYITMKDRNKPYEIEDLHKYEEDIDELKFTVPHQPSDLASWGSMMHNCIASYSDRYRTKECILLGIYDKKCGELLYNMEIRKNRVIQLRAKRNTSIENKDHRHIINKYCKKHDIRIDIA